jgi:hypothetical protein
MRRAFLFRSIDRVLGEGTIVYDAAYIWARHRWTLPYGGAVFVFVALVAPVVGVDDWPTRTVIGLAATAVAVTAATDYRVVAQTADGLVLLKASRIRQVAVDMVRRLPDDAELEQVGGTILAAEWNVDGLRYTVARSSEAAMNRMSLSGSIDD